MRHASQATVVAVILSLTTVFSAGDRLFAADPYTPGSKPHSYPDHSKPSPAPGKPGPYPTPHPYGPSVTSPGQANPYAHAAAPILEKLRDLGAHLGRALDIAVDLLSGNEAEFLSKNKTTLLSGNNPAILSGNRKVLSENTTPVLSGNTFSVFSNIKVEIHIDNSGNNMAGPPRPAGPNANDTRPRTLREPAGRK